MTESLADKLRMDHLINTSTEDLKASALKAVGDDPKNSTPAGPDPRDQELYNFQFDWTDVRGKKWAGKFTNKILDFGGQQAVAVLKAKFCGGMPLESIDRALLELNGIVAHMTYSLVETPDWAKDLRKINDLALIAKLGAEVMGHESYYFRLGETQE